MGGAARPRGRDASAACRSGTTTRRATDTPHSLTGIHSATGQRWCSFSLNGPDSCSRWGRGTRATPRRARPPPAVTLQLPRPAEQGTRLKTDRRAPPVLAHSGMERETPVHRPAHPLPPPGLRVPHSPEGKRLGAPTPTTRNPGNSALRPRRAPPGAGSPAREARPRPGLPGGRLRHGLCSRPGGQAQPSRPAVAGWGRAGCRRSAGRGGCAEGRGEGRAARRGRPHLRHCNACSRRVIILGGNGGRRGGRGLGGTWATRGTDRAQGCLGRPREPATGQVPRDLACGRPVHPRERESGTGAHPGRGVDPEASSPRLPRAALPSPAEKKPPPVSA